MAVMADGRSTTELLHAALDADSGAWNEIVDEYSGLLWWIARSHRLDHATAADVVQTVWLQLVQYGRSIRDPERLAGWLATTTRREALRKIAAARRQLPTEEMQDRIADDETDPEAQLLAGEATAEALAAFHLLGSSCKKLLSLLCEVPPKSYGEISALLSMPIGSIGPTRQRCLTTLRSEMRGMGVL